MCIFSSFWLFLPHTIAVQFSLITKVSFTNTFSWHFLPAQPSISPLCITQTFTCRHSLTTFSVTPLLSSSPTQFFSFCQNKTLLIKLRKTSATGSNSLTMEQDSKLDLKLKSQSEKIITWWFWIIYKWVKFYGVWVVPPKSSMLLMLSPRENVNTAQTWKKGYML